jgi:ABC-2 type transport system permease protein
MSLLVAARDTWRMESVRLRTVRSSYLLVGVAVLINGVLALLVGLLVPSGPMDRAAQAAALTAAAPDSQLPLLGTLFAVLGVLTVGHDYRYRLARSVLVVQPRRSVLFAARLGVLAVVGAGAALAGVLLGATICLVLGRRPELDPVSVRVLLAHLLVVVLSSWLGAGLAWVARGVVGPIVLLLIVPLMVEPAVTLAGHLHGRWEPLARVAPWLPSAAARAATSRRLWGTGPDLGAAAGAGAFAALTAVVLLAGWLSLRHRDA